MILPNAVLGLKECLGCVEREGVRGERGDYESELGLRSAGHPGIEIGQCLRYRRSETVNKLHDFRR